MVHQRWKVSREGSTQSPFMLKDPHSAQNSRYSTPATSFGEQQRPSIACALALIGSSPETVESLFIAFRLTGDPKYRDYGWQIFEAIDKHCKVPEYKGGGYVSIRNVDRVEGEKGWDDKMETFFLVS